MRKHFAGKHLYSLNDEIQKEMQLTEEAFSVVRHSTPDCLNFPSLLSWFFHSVVTDC